MSSIGLPASSVSLILLAGSPIQEKKACRLTEQIRTMSRKFSGRTVTQCPSHATLLGLKRYALGGWRSGNALTNMACLLRKLDMQLT
jgi:hypothetical protein